MKEKSNLILYKVVAISLNVFFLQKVIDLISIEKQNFQAKTIKINRSKKLQNKLNSPDVS